MTAKAARLSGSPRLGRVAHSRWRALVVTILVLAVTVFGSGIALARTDRAAS